MKWFIWPLITIFFLPLFDTSSVTRSTPLFYGDVSKASIEINESVLFAPEDFEYCMAIVLGRFTEWFKGCTLLRLYADEAQNIYANKNLVGIEIDDNQEMLILLIDFRTGDDRYYTGLEPNSYYQKYTWTFTKLKTGYANDWELINHGYE